MLCLESVPCGIVAGGHPSSGFRCSHIRGLCPTFQPNATHDAFDNRIVTNSPAVIRTSHRVSKTSWTPEGVGQLALTRGHFLGYEFDRMVILFSMVDGQREIPCAISTSAMDDLEGVARSMPDQREAQFMRLRDRIEERAARKFLAREFEGTPPGIVLRSIDFQT